MTQQINLSKIFEAASFTARKHQGQVRKDSQGSPYVTHPLKVAQVIWQIGRIDETSILVAAILHDTIEDTNTTAADIQDHFGEEILSIVLELTDDKSMMKMERKRMQVIHAPELSYPARIIKLGDKLTNCRDILHSPPQDWSLDRRQNYIQWASDVIAKIRGTNLLLEAAFDEMLSEAQEKLKFRIEPFDTVTQRPWSPFPRKPLNGE